MKEEDLLKWRSVSVFQAVPQDVLDARMSLLSEEDTELLKTEFSSRGPGRVYDFAPRGRETLYLYFGGNLRGSPAENAVDTMLRCSEIGKTYDRSIRLFKASAAYDADRELAVRDENGCAATYREAKYREMMEKAVKMNEAAAYKVIDSYWNNGEAYVVVNSGGESDEVVPVWCKRCTVCGDTFLDYKTDAKETGNRVTEIFEKYQKYLWWILLALVVVWSLFIGLRWALQRNDQEKVKTRSMLANYVLGLFVIAVIIVGIPYLVYGIAILVG